MIKVACAGFPVSQKRYQNQLRTVELTNLFDSSPRTSTIEKWGRNAGPDFEFVVCASKTITHPEKRALTHTRPGGTGVGYFQNSEDVKIAFQRSWGTAEILNAKIILFKCPEHWTPHPDHAQRIHAFFKPLPRGTKHFVWEPPTSWPMALIETMSKQLNLTATANPLSKTYQPIAAPMRYFRIGLSGKTSGQGAMSIEELKVIKKACDRPLSYVVFNNGPTAFADAVRFQTLI